MSNISVLDKVRNSGIISIDSPIGRFQHELDYHESSAPRSDRSLVLDLAPPLYYPSSLSKIYDRSPFSNHGTITGATWKRLPSGLWLLNFDGDDSIDCGDPVALRLANDFSVEMWISLDASQGAFHDPIGHGHTSTDGWIWQAVAAAGNNLDCIFGNGIGISGPSFGDLRGAGWAHLLVTKSSVTGALAFKNGLLFDSLSARTGDIPNPSVSELHIGQNAPGGRNMRGRIGEVRIYDRVLSAAEIFWLYLTTRWRYL